MPSPSPNLPPNLLPNLLIVLDDRELTDGELHSLVGCRHYGDIIVRRQPLADHFRAALPAWARHALVHLRDDGDLPALRARLEASDDDCAVCVIAGRAGFPDPDRLAMLVERLPYAEEDFTDRPYKPLLLFLRHAHQLLEYWPAFAAGPVHGWEQGWRDAQRVQSLQPLDISTMRGFLSLTTGATAARHFNQVDIDTYFYTKSSTDQAKMKAEYLFHSLVPEEMRPWLIQPFGYEEGNGRASYRMMRYYLADVALQWVHDAFDAESFQAFVERLLFFIASRPRQPCSAAESAQAARSLFVDKVEQRARQFLAMPEGRRIDALAAAGTPELALERQLERYLRLYRKHERQFQCDHMAIGHGDPCFSNVLYDQQRYLMKLIDPKGALSAGELWTHPMYDLCKISHSVLGDYDFINNSQYRVGFTDDNALRLHLNLGGQAALKPLFTRHLRTQGYDPRIVRLGEASLFLSMLPLHIDVPNKVLAFLLKAHAILNEVEHDD